jgi:hypothetical protein
MRNAYAVKPDPRLSWGGLQHPASDLSPARCMSSRPATALSTSAPIDQTRTAQEVSKAEIGNSRAS